MPYPHSWKEKLAARIPEELGREIDVFESQLELRRHGKIDERVFAETRLRRGVYGQRYDNGQRHDGRKVQNLRLGVPGHMKGPDTAWNAPGMMRIKIPFGGMTPEQMRVLADLSEEYADGIVHVTTRQDVQYHFVHIDDTPDIMRRLAAVELLPTAQAVARVFVRLGEKRDRARARIKFLVARLGIDEFRRTVLEERRRLDPDPAWTEFLEASCEPRESPLENGGARPGAECPTGFEEWASGNDNRATR